ncbi:MAG: hypothetical protein WCA89_13545, partial [Terracidiphilus sp.]
MPHSFAILIRPQRNATLLPTHSAKSAEWMGHSVSKLLGRINSMVSQKLIEEQPQIPFGYA